MSVIDEIATERRRQIVEEGWDDEHDDQWNDNQLAAAAACYAMPDGLPDEWPWTADWWKPKDRRRDLIRAAALLVAEIERIDRASTGPTGENR